MSKPDEKPIGKKTFVLRKKPVLSFFRRLRKGIFDYFRPEGIEKDMLRYRDNKISSSLGYLSLLCDSAGFCLIYSSTAISGQDSVSILGIASSGFWAGFDVILNILMLLFLFMAISKMRAYSKGWGVFSITQGIFQIIRPFVYPLALFSDGILSESIFTAVTILFLVSGILLVIAGLLAIYRGVALRRYLSTVKAIENEKVRMK
jgi:hypothetical protein